MDIFSIHISSIHLQLAAGYLVLNHCCPVRVERGTGVWFSVGKVRETLHSMFIVLGSWYQQNVLVKVCCGHPEDENGPVSAPREEDEKWVIEKKEGG